MRQSLPSCLVIVVFSAINSIYALQNITVHASDSRISYFPSESWTKVEDFAGPRMSTRDRSAFATFMFTGVAIYFMSPRWPASGSSAVTITIDNGDTVLPLSQFSAPGRDQDIFNSRVIAQATGLLDTTHTVRVSVGAGQVTILDGFLFTTTTSEEGYVDQNRTPVYPRMAPLGKSAHTSPAIIQNSSSESAWTLPKPSYSSTVGLLLGIASLNLVIALAIALTCCFSQRHRKLPPRLVPKPAPILPVRRPTTGNKVRQPLPVPSSPPRQYSPARFAVALRNMIHSPARAYPVRPLGGVVIDPVGSRPLSSISHVFAPPEARIREPTSQMDKRDQWAYPEAPLAYVPLLK
ncbi:hypothetical protein GALMADRAFT_151392 [Galerina marginata CBS 339.88]|uniref:Transmembrane protein n=1 Tax=Galerina marginata (strain CBS 339.88) TaxID=685588 RepID=A0A067TQF0_GALM3|nr:hypothetical protein GALMADRAFT_151392 [Galerina marginata CBS 339.88]